MSFSTANTIALVRHGETDWNLARRIQGRTDIALNDTGRAQAAETGQLLASHGSWAGLVSSPLRRAVETAEIIGSTIDRTAPTIDEGIWERNFGHAEGMHFADADARWPGLRGIPESEPLEDMSERGAAALLRLLETAPGSVVVSHGALIRWSLSRIAGSPLPRVLNGEIWMLSLDHESGAAPRVERFAAPGPVQDRRPTLLRD